MNNKNWKLTLPNGKEVLNLEGYSNPPYFHLTDSMVFRAPVNGSTTPNSSYPRSEFREMTNGKLASWSTKDVRSMYIEQAITAVPKKKRHVVAGQIHDSEDDVIVIRLEFPKLFIDINGTDGPVLEPNYVLGTKFSVKFETGGGDINIYYNGVFKHTMRKTISGCYFKAGCYTQSNCSKEDDCSVNNYGEVKIYQLYLDDVQPPVATPTIEQWAKAIQKHEGYFPGSASYRNNNPGNFRCSSLIMGELGATSCVNNLAVFPTFETGWKALVQFLTYAVTDKLRSYRSTMSLLDFYKVYAPSADNNSPINYATAVAKDLGVTIDTKISTFLPTTPPPTPTTPNYFFSQNNPLWKSVTIGKSKSTLGEYGCTIDCSSDASSYFGEETLPSILAKKLSYQVDKIIWSSIGSFFKKFKFLWRFYSHDAKLISEGLNNPDKVVLLNVDRGYHWVFLLGKSSTLGYRCSDPYPYPAKVRYYKQSEVAGGAILGKK